MIRYPQEKTTTEAQLETRWPTNLWKQPTHSDVPHETPKNKTADTLKKHYKWPLSIVASLLASTAIIITATMVYLY